ncbi:MAG: GT4 family glycosyltransferase PelF, partial [bacterium]|nr:GT4 family glycosyltransferase PelF [bacterium]
WYEIEIGASELECGFNITKTQCNDLALGKTWYDWLNVFKNFARYSYRNADAISTVCYANREKQLSLNADPNKCHVISNGVDINSGIRARKSPGKQVNIALIGKVTPIKQIEIFIQACVRVKSKFPAAKFYMIGPVDHDRDYFMRMVALKNQLNLDELIFTGEINTKEILNRLDLVVLTSKSEGQPFALLESMAAGVPVIATDVGGCADVVNGLEDGFDAAGKICSVGDVAGISVAMIELLTKPVLWRQCAQAGINRVSSFYRSEMFLNAYRKLYLKHTVLRANLASTILAG